MGKEQTQPEIGETNPPVWRTTVVPESKYNVKRRKGINTQTIRVKRGRGRHVGGRG